MGNSIHRSNLIHKLSLQNSIKSAWLRVQKSCRNSDSQAIVSEAEQFHITVDQVVRKIQKQLRNKSYKFSKYRAVKIQSPGKSVRPLTVPCIKDRIVQRAILDILQKEKLIKSTIENKYSFGGLSENTSQKGKTSSHSTDPQYGVRTAIKTACLLMNSGHNYYIRTDIKKFFTKIPRDKVLTKLSRKLNDKQFIDLLREATTVEFENLSKMGKDSKLFPQPGSNIGAAQGICLSPLFGNLLLSNFDIEMNSEHVKCLRYIDDLLILGKTKQDVWATYRLAVKHLDRLGMELYHPLKKEDRSKSSCGTTAKAFDYLGCRINAERVLPSNDSCSKLVVRTKQSLDGILRYSRKSTSHFENTSNSFAELNRICLGVISWGKYYNFCNSKEKMIEVDHKIAEEFSKFFAEFSGIIYRAATPIQRGAALGVPSTYADKRNQIYPLSKKTSTTKRNPQLKGDLCW